MTVAHCGVDIGLRVDHCENFGQTPVCYKSACNAPGFSLLVEFQGGNESIMTPDDPTKYTVDFGTDGRVTIRIDCNQGSGTWTSEGPNHLVFGPLTLTRAQCRRAPPRPHRQRLGIRSVLRHRERPPVRVTHGRRRDLRVRARTDPQEFARPAARHG